MCPFSVLRLRVSSCCLLPGCFYHSAGEKISGCRCISARIASTTRESPPLHHHYGLTIQIGDRQSFFLRPYANDYNSCIEEAQNDQRRDARPELKSYPDSIASYDDIYLGFPNYWGTMPMPVFTFLQHFDFSGKTIHPFCTHEGSGLGRSLSDIQRLCPKALIAPALAISGTHASQSSPQVHRWLTQSLHAPSASHSQHKTI